VNKTTNSTGGLSEHAFTPYQEARAKPTDECIFCVLDTRTKFIGFILFVALCIFICTIFWYFVLNTLWSIVFINMPTEAQTIFYWTLEAVEVAATTIEAYSKFNVYNMDTFCESLDKTNTICGCERGERKGAEIK